MMSVSWKASEPMAGRVTWPVTTTMGTESIWAVAIPVTRFVAPRSRRRPGHAGPAGDTGVAVRRVSGPPAHAVQVCDGVPGTRAASDTGAKIAPPGSPNNHIHAFSNQRFTNYLSTVASHFAQTSLACSSELANGRGLPLFLKSSNQKIPAQSWDGNNHV